MLLNANTLYEVKYSLSLIWNTDFKISYSFPNYAILFHLPNENKYDYTVRIKRWVCHTQ